MEQAGQREGWEVPRSGDCNRNLRMHYVRLGVSLCHVLGNARRPLQDARPDTALLCRPCDRERSRELERAGT